MSNVRRVQDIYAAFGRGDLAAVLSAFDAQVAWSEAEGNPYQPSGKAWVGPEVILEQLFARLGAEWEAFTVHPRQYHDAGDTIIVEGRYAGRFKRTGRLLDAQLCHLWTFRAGKLTHFQQYVDTAQLQTVMRTT